MEKARSISPALIRIIERNRKKLHAIGVSSIFASIYTNAYCMRCLTAAENIFAHKGVRVSIHEILGLTVLFGAIGGLSAGALSASPLMGLGVSFIPFVLLARAPKVLAQQQQSLINDQMQAAFRSLNVSLGSGLSLTQAMKHVGEQLHDPLGREFTRASFEVRCGMSSLQALKELGERINSPHAELLVSALSISEKTGSPLNELLEAAGEQVRETIELKRRLTVKTSQAHLSAQVVGSLPLILAFVLALISPDYRAGLSEFLGIACLAGALFLDVIGMRIIRSIIAMDVTA